MDKLTQLKLKQKAMLARLAHWKSCKDGSYQMALETSGYNRLCDEIKKLEKES